MPLGRPGEPDPYLRRTAIAGGAAVVVLTLLALLGPDPDDVRRWLLHTGIEGPIEILPELDIVPDESEIAQRAQETMAGATEGLPAPQDQPTPVEESETRVPTPRPDDQTPEHWTRRLEPSPNPSRDDERRAESHTRTRRSLDFVLQKFVRPDYPSGVSASVRSREVRVLVAMYVNERGQVEEAYVVSSDGGRIFDEAALRAVRQWEYRPVVFDRRPQGFWDQQLIRFVVSDGGETVELETG